MTQKEKVARVSRLNELEFWMESEPLLLMVGDLYQNRETTSLSKVAQIPMSMTVQRLIAPYRRSMV